MMYRVVIAVLCFQLYLSLSWAQAPGDEEDRCTVDHNDPPVYPDTQKNLMDSWSYVNLLPGNGTGRTLIATAVWNDYSYDGNDQVNLFTQTYWQQTSGGICRFISKVCGYTIGTQNNWLFTQYINKSFDTNTYNYDVTIRVTIAYSMSSCRPNRNPPCVQGLTLLNYMSTSMRLPSFQGNGYMNRNSYQIFAYPSAQANNVPYTNTYTFTLPASTTGFYIAVRDNGTCMSISRLRVYRNNCKPQQVGLVLYPDAPAPVSTSANINVQCVENAEFSSGSSRVAACTSSGTWGTVTPACQCRLGYERIEEDSESQCIACPAGEYRSVEDNTCQPCPANTITTEITASFCQCISGYYRYNRTLTDPLARLFLPDETEPYSAGCTKPPGPPRSVSLTPQARSITLRWQPPSDNGGRADVYFNLSRSDADNVRSFTLPAQYLSGSTRSYSFTGLNPSTEYCVRLTSNNGVSFQDPGRVHLRTVEKCTTTLADRPGIVAGVQGRYPYVVWNPPEQPNGVITGYRLVFSRSGTTTIRTINTNNDQTYYIIQSSDIPWTSGEFRVTVAAKNSAGVGPQSTPFTLQLDSSCPSITPTSTTSVTDPPTTTSSCPTTTCPTCLTPTSTPPPPIGSVTSVEVLGCGVISWKPPPGNEGLELGYVVRFFDGTTYDSSSNREIQRYFDDTGRQWAVAGTSVNDGGTLYADIRARDLTNRCGVYSGRFLVANSSICTKKCSAKNEGLVRYPTALAPDSGSVSVTTQCADNAQLRSGYSLSVRCNSDGTWSGTIPQCQCNNGYRTNSSGSICEAIPICPAKIEGLVHYPSTSAPNTNSRSVTTRCADNAASGSLSVRCNSDGTWSGTIPTCTCNSGYRVKTVSGRQFCETIPTCEAKTENLVSYSKTSAPNTGFTTKTVQCVGNATLRSGSLSVRCNSDGSWSGNPQCQCNSGYQQDEQICRFICPTCTPTPPTTTASTPTTTVCPPPTTPTPPVIGSVTSVEVLGCGVISWKPPPGNEGLELGYVVRFFDGTTYDSSSSREIQRYFDDTGRQWAVAGTSINDGGTLYADIRARDSNERLGAYSGRFLVANSSICTKICSAKNEGLVRYPTALAPDSGSVSVTTKCADNAQLRSGYSLNVRCNSDGTWSGTIPQCQCNNGYQRDGQKCQLICQTCPTCETCPTCQTCETCPTSPTCPTCPTCPTPSTATTSITSTTDCPTIMPPSIGSVTSVEVLGCGVISWKPPTGNEGLELGYVVRFFDGSSYDSSSKREIQRRFSDFGRQWAVAGTSVNDGGTLYADIRARDSNERLGAYSGRFLVANSSICTKKCSAKNEGLVRYPTALAPDSGSVSVTTQCADNAQLRSSYSLNVRCNSDGTWSGTIPQCQCNNGYRVKTVSEHQICEALPRCEVKTEDLVRYPLTLAPNSGSKTITVQCVGNATLRSGSLSVRCNSDGTWSGNPQCQCNSGYQAVTIEGQKRYCLDDTTKPPTNTPISITPPTNSSNQEDIDPNPRLLFGIHTAWNTTMHGLKSTLEFTDGSNKVLYTDTTELKHYKLDTETAWLKNIDDSTNIFLKVSTEDRIKRDTESTTTLHFTKKELRERIRKEAGVLVGEVGQLSGASTTEASIDGTSIAIAIVLTFALTAAAIIFLCIALGLVLQKHSKMKKEKTVTPAVIDYSMNDTEEKSGL